MERNKTADSDLMWKNSGVLLVMLVVLRTAIGWHFLYEGIAKLFIPGWTAAGFLQVSKLGVFQWMSTSPGMMAVVDFLNIAGLIAIGMGLIFGLFSRIAAGSGVVLLFLYYIAHPPFVGMDFGMPAEGNYLIVDKNIVELAGLAVLALFPTGRFLGLDRLIILLRTRQPAEPATSAPANEAKPPLLDRRELMRNLVSVPVIGAFAGAVFYKYRWESYEEKILKQHPDAVSRATIRTFNFSSLSDLQGRVPHAKIKDLDLSRIVLGGNLIGGWAHSRDLIYVSKLVRAYHSRDKIFETLAIAEKCGINALITNPVLSAVINEYWRRDIGKIQFISDSGGSSLIEGAKVSIDMGAAACYTHGEMTDRLAREGNVEEIGKALDFIRQNNLPAGIGCHQLETVKACVDYGITPDYWMKTFHHTNYWSAKPGEQHDNIWCTNPDETMAFMRGLEQPWIAFKTLAAGAIPPDVGFKFAFEGGADFVCVGMYDFQIVDDVNIALAVLNGNLQRERPWHA